MRVLLTGFLILLGWSGAFAAQVSVSAHSSATAGKTVQVTIGIFEFELGEKFGVEIAREEPCPCLCDGIVVQGFRILDAEGRVVYEDPGAFPTPAARWVGLWGLVDSEGNPVSPGNYTALIVTSLGEFRVGIRVVESGGRSPGRSFARATVCGLDLRVYRVLTEEDHGTTVHMGEGQYLLIALPGNPTTGYGWEVREVPEFLEAVAGVDYLPAEEGLVGAGGTFFFRFRAKGAGEGNLSLIYRRPWEEEAPARTFSVTVVAAASGWETLP